MRALRWIVIGGTAAIAAITGFVVQPAPLKAPGPSPVGLDRVPTPDGLPKPVADFFRSAYGDTVPVTETVSLWGRVRMRIGGLRFNAVMRNHHLLGHAFRARFAGLWYGRPFIKGAESFADGAGSSQAAGSDNAGPEVDQANMLFMWSEAFMYPYAHVVETDVSWEEIDDSSARLILPIGDTVESAIVSFDQHARPITYRAERFKGTGERMGWTVGYQHWRWLGDLLVPAVATVTWDDEASPWLRAQIEGVTANTDDPWV